MAVDGAVTGSRRACRRVRLGGARAAGGDASLAMFGIDGKARFDAMAGQTCGKGRVRQAVVTG